MNRTTSMPKSVPCYVLDKGQVLQSGILLLSLLFPNKETERQAIPVKPVSFAKP